MTVELQNQGWVVNHKRVERLTALHGIVGTCMHAKVRTTNPAEHNPPVPDLVGRGFKPGELDMAWVDDIAYIPTGWMTGLTGRSPMKSPRAPLHRREKQREFWLDIETAITTEEAAAVIGVSHTVGAHWFRHAGGTTPLDLAASSGRYLSFVEREEIAILNATGVSGREIARRLERSPSTVSRELRRKSEPGSTRVRTPE